MIYVILALLALAGGAFSFYFLQVYRGKMASEVWWIPSICRMSEESCRSIVDTTYGRILGKPNAFWGTFFYPVLLVLITATALFELDPRVLFYTSLAAFLLTLYLIWGLLVLRVLCRVCTVIHAVNILFFLVLVGDGKI